MNSLDHTQVPPSWMLTVAHRPSARLNCTIEMLRPTGARDCGNVTETQTPQYIHREAGSTIVISHGRIQFSSYHPLSFSSNPRTKHAQRFSERNTLTRKQREHQQRQAWRDQSCQRHRGTQKEQAGQGCRSQCRRPGEEPEDKLD